MEDESKLKYKIDIYKFHEIMRNNFLNPRNSFTAENPFMLRSVTLFGDNRLLTNSLTHSVTH